MKLRDYQTESITAVKTVLRNGKRKPVLVMPTGAGKSVVFAEIISLAVGKGNKVLWLVHRRNLVFQMRDTLKDFDIDAGIIMAGEEPTPKKQVQIGTVQTYGRRLEKDTLQIKDYFDADLVMIDEAHRSISPTYQKILDLYKDKIVIGCTATPMRADQRGLGEVYDSIVEVVGVKELTDKGYLSPARYFAPSDIDLSKITMQMGDYQVKALGGKMNTPKLVGDIVENWLKFADDRKTIVFAVNVKHAKSITEAFEKAGITSYHLNARSPDSEREYVFKQMESGEIKVITNVALYQEGMDVPGISCVVMARPTKSLGLYKQCCGRGLRPSPGKENCIIMDHGGVIYEHGFLDEAVFWSLDGKKKAWSTKLPPKESQPVRCKACNAVFKGLPVCPDCGSPVKSYSKAVKTAEAELTEVGKVRQAAMAEKRRFYGMAEHYRQSRGFKPGWTAHNYRDKFGVWPVKRSESGPIEPDDSFRNWMTCKMIKYKRGKQGVIGKY